jgi:5-methylcytosine-specific restriction endonuclease McrA
VFVLKTKIRRNQSKVRTLSLEELQNILHSCNSYSDVMRKLGLSVSGSSVKILKNRIEEEKGLDISHFENSRRERRKEIISNLHQSNKISLDKILVKNSTYTHTNTLKKRLIKEGVLEEKCSKCNLGTEWNDQKITLHLDHINGNSNDNRLSNLRILCPNCHSQTPTYAGRRSKRVPNKKENKKIYKCSICNSSKGEKSKVCIKCHLKKNSIESIHQRKVERPSKEELNKLIQTKSFLQIAKEYGVSDNGVRKWCKYYGLPYRKKDINNQLVKS